MMCPECTCIKLQCNKDKLPRSCAVFQTPEENMPFNHSNFKDARSHLTNGTATRDMHIWNILGRPSSNTLVWQIQAGLR
jgi:hypothetical protein